VGHGRFANERIGIDIDEFSGEQEEDLEEDATTMDNTNDQAQHTANSEEGSSGVRGTGPSPAESSDPNANSDGEEEVKRTWSAEYMVQQYRSIGKRLKKRVEESGMTKEEKQESFDDIDLLMAKYKKMWEPKKRKKKCKTPYPVTMEEVV
jgi:hypothetical protein